MTFCKNFMKLLTTLLLLGCIATGLIAQELPFPSLSGPFSVGLVQFTVKDASRQDILAPIPQPVRLISITAYYPIDSANAKGERADYIPLIKPYAKAYNIPEFLGSFKKRSFPNKEVSGVLKQYPVVIFSPGFDLPDVFYTALLEEIASYGYIVVSVSLPYISGPVYIPEENRIIPMPSYDPKNPDGPTLDFNDPEGSRKRVALCLEEGVKDFEAIFKALGDWNSAEGLLHGKLDLAKVTCMGHSMGGMISVVYCSKANAKCVGGINLDGGAYSNPEPDHTGSWLSRKDMPFLKIRCLFNAGLDQIPPSLIGPNQSVVDIERFYHQIFSDVAFFRDAFPNLLPPPEMPLPMPKEGWMPGKFAFKIITGYILAFLSQVSK